MILAIAALAFAVRAIDPPPAGAFGSNDALYHVRYAENLAAHFPAWSTFDPYLRPDGESVPVAPLLDILIAGFSLPFGHLETVAVWLPPLLGALAVVPLFFFGRRASWIAAFLLAILPGEFLARSRAGSTDHHVLEVLLMLATLALLCRALERERRTDAVVAGFFLALYCLAWSSAAMGVVILVGVSLFALSHAKPFAWMFGTAALLFAPFTMLVPRGVMTLVLLVIGTVVTFTAARKGTVVALLAGAAATLAAKVFVPHAPGVFQGYARFFLPGSLSRTVAEGRSLLHGDGATIIWNELALAGVAAAIGIAILARDALRKKRPEDFVLLAASIAFIAAAIAQRRFLYYAAPFVALLAAVALSRLTPRLRLAALAAIAISIALAPGWHVREHDMTPPMREAMAFLRGQTPEPFGDPSVYLQRFTSTAPRAAYSVLAWWDHGYSIVRAAHRVPTSNPTQAGARDTAAFLLAQDETTAAPIADRLRARYVLVDDSLMVLPPRPGEVSIGGELAQVALWNREDGSRYFEQYLYGDRLVWLFYPEYFRSMAGRLYLFGGAGAPARYMVVTFTDEGDRKRIVSLARYARYRDAMNAVLLDPSHHKRIVSEDPLQSCAPVEPLTHYHEVFRNGSVRVFERR